MADFLTPKLWIEHQGRTVGAFGRRVHALLDAWQDGIYHLQREVTHKRVEWDNEHRINIVIYGTLDTYDSDGLTRLVFLAHDHAIRVGVSGASHRHLRLSFWPRSHGQELGWSARHPTLAEAVERHRTRHQAPTSTTTHRP